MDKQKAKDYMLLHLILLIYSFGGILSKTAAQFEFASKKFLFFYCLSLLTLVFYSVAWQFILKRMPLSIAYANKSAIVIWGIIWGIFIFGENLSFGKVLGALFIIYGIYSMKED